MAAVAVLVVIAIAGIVLASLRGRGAPADTPAVVNQTLPAASPMTGVDPAVAQAEAAAGPNQVVFAAESDQLSEPATTKLIQFADSQKKVKGGLIVIAGKVEVGSNRMALAQKRAFAVREVLAANGIRLGTMQVKIAEVPLGLVSASEANRIEFTVP